LSYRAARSNGSVELLESQQKNAKLAPFKTSGVPRAPREQVKRVSPTDRPELRSTPAAPKSELRKVDPARSELRASRHHNWEMDVDEARAISQVVLKNNPQRYRFKGQIAFVRPRIVPTGFEDHSMLRAHVLPFVGRRKEEFSRLGQIGHNVVVTRLLRSRVEWDQKGWKRGPPVLLLWYTSRSVNSQVVNTIFVYLVPPEEAARVDLSRRHILLQNLQRKDSGAFLGEIRLKTSPEKFKPSNRLLSVLDQTDLRRAAV